MRLYISSSSPPHPQKVLGNPLMASKSAWLKATTPPKYLQSQFCRSRTQIAKVCPPKAASFAVVVVVQAAVQWSNALASRFATAPVGCACTSKPGHSARVNEVAAALMLADTSHTRSLRITSKTPSLNSLWIVAVLLPHLRDVHWPLRYLRVPPFRTKEGAHEDHRQAATANAQNSSLRAQCTRATQLLHGAVKQRKSRVEAEVLRACCWQNVASLLLCTTVGNQDKYV